MSTKLHEGDVVCALKSIGEKIRKEVFYVVRDVAPSGSYVNLAHDDETATMHPFYADVGSFQRLGSPLDFKKGSRWLTRNSQCVFFKEARRESHNNEIYSVFTDKDGYELTYWPTLKRQSTTREMDILMPYDGVGSFLRGPVPPEVEGNTQQAAPRIEPVETQPAKALCEYCSLQYNYGIMHVDPCQYTHLEVLMPPLAKEIFRRNAKARDEAVSARNQQRNDRLVLGACERSLTRLPVDKLSKDLLTRYGKLTGTPAK